MWEAFLMKSFVQNVVPETTQHRREWLIQNAKLLRIIMKPVSSSATPMRMLAGKVSVKKYHKQRVKQSVAVGQQARKLRTLTDKMFKQLLRTHNPKLTNAEYRQWKARLDTAVNERIEENAKQISQKSADQLTNG